MSMFVINKKPPYHRWFLTASIICIIELGEFKFTKSFKIIKG